MTLDSTEADLTTTSSADPRIDVVIVNYRTPDALRRCLLSLPSSVHSRTWVVDNASGDESCDLVRDEFPAVNLLASQENVLFPGGVALALAQSTAAYALVLNADVELRAGTLDTLTATLDSHPEAALVGPLVRGEHGELQPSCFPWPTPGDYLLAELGVFRLLRRFGIGRGGRLTPRLWNHDTEAAVPWVLGCAFALRRSAFDDVGGFDPRFPMYFEEVDLCARLTGAGWQVRFTPDAVVTHQGGASTRQAQAEMSRRMYRSMATYCRVHSPRSIARLQASVLLSLLALATKLLVHAWSRDGRRRMAALLPGHLQVAGDAINGWKQP